MPKDDWSSSAICQASPTWPPSPPAWRRAEWVVYAKRPFAGPEAVLAYLARHTHRLAISSSRLVAWNEGAVTFRWQDDRQDGQARRKLMT